MIFFSDNYLGKAAVFIYCVLIAGYSSLLLPKRFPVRLTVLLFFWGYTVDTIYDYTIGGHVLDFYDTFVSPRYTLMDLLTYFAFGPMPYIFIYLYEDWQIRGRKTIFFIAGWSVLSIFIEKWATSLGVFTYKNGYQLYYSFPIYLYTQSLTIRFYHWAVEAQKNRSVR
ncbi:hypothetical protein LJK87_28065 [Paenibacillus sp. P25]|nr:hypothetical protein LJK87_28065 [Paenibacillus sp. P25]